MAKEIIIALGGFAVGLASALYSLRLEKKKSRAQVSLLKNSIVQNLENILDYYRKHYRFQNVSYKAVDLSRDVWHNKFLMEKFFLITGLYETDSYGRVGVRGNIDASLIERFLSEVKKGDFDKLLAIVADVPSGAFYSYSLFPKEQAESAVSAEHSSIKASV